MNNIVVGTLFIHFEGQIYLYLRIQLSLIGHQESTKIRLYLYLNFINPVISNLIIWSYWNLDMCMHVFKRQCTKSSVSQPLGDAVTQKPYGVTLNFQLEKFPPYWIFWRNLFQTQSRSLLWLTLNFLIKKGI